MDLKKYKYQLKATSVGINGVLYRKSDKTIFDPSDKKWQKVDNEIVAAFKNGHLEMTKESKKKYDSDVQAKEKAEKEAKEKAEKNK